MILQNQCSAFRRTDGTIIGRGGRFTPTAKELAGDIGRYIGVRYMQVDPPAEAPVCDDIDLEAEPHATAPAPIVGEANEARSLMDADLGNGTGAVTTVIVETASDRAPKRRKRRRQR